MQQPAPQERAALWRLLFITMVRLLNTVEGDLKSDADLTLIDIGCLLALANAGKHDGRSMGSLASVFGVDPSVITYRVKRLEGLGYVQREPADADRRSVLVALTPNGRHHLRLARASLLASADRHFFDHVDPADLPGFERLLSSLLAGSGPSSVSDRDG